MNLYVYVGPYLETDAGFDWYPCPVVWNAYQDETPHPYSVGVG
jgi:hypothetical protein